MDDSIAHSGPSSIVWELPGWKTAASAVSAVLLAIIFVGAGVWKITDPFQVADRLVTLKVPAQFSLAATGVLGAIECWTGVLLVVPRFRRWGAWLAGIMLVAFMLHIGYYYEALHGQDCSCFPWLKRAVGPGFFISDGVMLALAVIAGWWGRRSASKRSAVLALAAITVFAGVSYGVNARMQERQAAPAQITVNGSPAALRQGRYLVFFFDPECTHCNQAARDMAKLGWRDVKIVGTPTEQPQFARYFMDHTGLHGAISNDTALLRKAFPFAQTPYAVALENGRRLDGFSDFEPQRMAERLRKIGFIQ